MFRKLTILTLAATLLIAGASPAYAQRGGGRGGVGGGGRGAVGGYGGYRGGYNGGYYRNNNNNWGNFGTGLAIGVGVGALARPYYGGYSYSSGYYADPGYSYAVPNTSYYSAPADAGYAPSVPMNRNTALINIHVAPGAQLFFGDTPAMANQTGMDRQFVSPPLEPGSNYQYVLRAIWNENGQTVDRTRTVAVHANDVVNVDFTRAN